MDFDKQAFGKPFESTFGLLFDLAVEAIFIEDIHGKVLACNEAAHRMFGYPHGQLVGKTIADLVPADFATILPPTIPDDMASGDYYVERINRKRDGTVFPTEVCTKFTYIEGEKRLIAYVHDLSEQKKIQKELEESRVKLQELINTKDKFFSIISHDLKNPMNTILGFTNLMRGRNMDKEKYVSFAELIHGAAESSSFLLENLLQWARSQSGALVAIRESVNLAMECDAVVSQLSDMASRKSITLTASCDPELWAFVDSNMYAFVVRNLVTNAIKFTPVGGKVDIYVSRNGATIQNKVVDNGVGMSPETVANLFALSTQEQQRGTMNEKGSGLGLVLCKEFLAYHQSELHVESRIGEGSTFWFNLAVGGALPR